MTVPPMSPAGQATGGVARRLPDRLRPSSLEVVCGLALGSDPYAAPLDMHGCGHPRPAIEAVVRRALERPPCLVSFSGGRDSSVVLAVAASVARRQSLPLPVPVSYRFEAAPGTREDDWQEAVVSHLDLPEWERLQMSSELDAVGPVAQGVLGRHGLVWPFNAHFHMPLLERARGGSLITGIGGDELLGRAPWHTARALLAGRERPRFRDVLAAGAPLAPRPLRRMALARRHEVRWPWLRPAVDEAINGRLAARRARTPLRWHGAVDWWWRSRSRTVLSATMDLLATSAGTQVVHPFLDSGVVAATAGFFGARGPVDRPAALRALLADGLPDGLLTRRSKAHFDEAFFSDHSHSFVETWSGGGVDTSLVDPGRLAAAWRAENPDPRSFLLLQAVWLAESGTVADHPRRDARRERSDD